MNLKVMRFGFGPYDGASANGWHVVRVTTKPGFRYFPGGFTLGAFETYESMAGPFCDAGVAHRHLQEIETKTATKLTPAPRTGGA